MTEKIVCDECHKLTDRRFIRVEFKEKDMDWGLTILRGDLDFCSLTCLESGLEHKRRGVTKISEKIPGKPETIRFMTSQGIEVREEDLEEGGRYVKKEVWEKLMKSRQQA
jgi:hypothetical protein